MLKRLNQTATYLTKREKYMTNQTTDSADLLNEILIAPSNETINNSFSTANAVAPCGTNCGAGCGGGCGASR